MMLTILLTTFLGVGEMTEQSIDIEVKETEVQEVGGRGKTRPKPPPVDEDDGTTGG